MNIASILLCAAVLSVGCTPPTPYDVTPEKPLGSFKVLNHHFKVLGLVRKERKDLGELSRAFSTAPRMYDYTINDDFQKNESHANDSILLLADNNDRVVGYMSHSIYRPRGSSRISRFSRRMWRKQGGTNPNFRSGGAPRVVPSIPHDSFQRGPVQAVWSRSGGYDTIYFILAR